MERDCEASHLGPHDADVIAPLVSTQVDSNDEFASQFAVQDDFRARNDGGVAVFASDDDFSQPRLKRLQLVSRRTWLCVGSPNLMLQIGEGVWSQFSVEGLYWSQGHQTTP